MTQIGTLNSKNYPYLLQIMPISILKIYSFGEKSIQVGATKPGVTSGSIGGKWCKVYAVKMQRGPEEIALGENIWSIYSLGVDRTASVLGDEGAGKEVFKKTISLQLIKVIDKL